jgi:uncharacterized protein (TIGR02300 family)
MKPEWGVKRSCQECGTKFYDMKRVEIVCPKCGTPFVAQTPKPKRTKADVKPEAPPKKVVVEAADPAVDVEDEDLVVGGVDVEDEDEEDSDVMEDTTDLGDDDDDVAEVMVKIDGEKEV